MSDVIIKSDYSDGLLAAFRDALDPDTDSARLTIETGREDPGFVAFHVHFDGALAGSVKHYTEPGTFILELDEVKLNGMDSPTLAFRLGGLLAIEDVAHLLNQMDFEVRRISAEDGDVGVAALWIERKD